MNSTTDDYEPGFDYEDDGYEDEGYDMKHIYIFIGSVLSMAGFTIALTGFLYRRKKMKEEREKAKKYIVNGEV